MNRQHTYFTSEAVSEGHPDKVADQISDAVLDAYLAQDTNAKVAVETLVTTDTVVVAGEVKSKADVDIESVVRKTILRIGYDKDEYHFNGNNVRITNLIHEQSADIRRGVMTQNPYDQGAGDQGMMFGYATNETDEYMPLPLYLANKILLTLREIRKEGEVMKYLRPDAKSQVTVEYDEEGKPYRVDTIVVSTQHDEFIKDNTFLTQEEADEEMHERIAFDVENKVIKRMRDTLPYELAALIDGETRILVNPTGKFVIGGPDGDTGLTGRKIIVDTYGGFGAHGGGACSGKSCDKTDRSAAYMARYIAKNLVAAGVADKCLVQLAYAIGVAEPVSINVNTYGTNKTDKSDAELAVFVAGMFKLTPAYIVEMLDLKHVRYEPTAAYGHFGRQAKATVDGVQYFPWEALDMVESIRLQLF